MRRTLTATQVQSQFNESLQLVEAGEIVEVTRNGRAVAGIVGTKDLEQIERLRASAPQEGLASLLGRWDDGDEMADEVDRVVATRSAPRPVPDFEP